MAARPVESYRLNQGATMVNVIYNVNHTCILALSVSNTRKLVFHVLMFIFSNKYMM